MLSNIVFGALLEILVISFRGNEIYCFFLPDFLKEVFVAQDAVHVIDLDAIRNELIFFCSADRSLTILVILLCLLIGVFIQKFSLFLWN